MQGIRHVERQYGNSTSMTRTRALSVAVTLFAAIGVFGVGVHYGAFAAADTDPYGYVSEAELIASGALRVDQRFALTMPWREAELSFIPTGFKQATMPGFMVPTFPPGLPLIMAASLRVTNSREAVFYVVPLLGAVMICATAVLGCQLRSELVGASAAVLLATSPSFVLQVTQPVSDVPAAAWWTLSVISTVHKARWAAPLGGVTTALAILTRPNLVPLAGVLGASYMWRVLRADTTQRRFELWRTTMFSVPVIAGCVAVGAINQYLYGSALRSGYASLEELYRWEHVVPNLDRYPRWLLTTQSPFIYLGVAAPFLTRAKSYAWLLLAFAAIVILSYIPYGYFERDNWGYLRFLLPAYPALIVLSLVAGAALLRRADPDARRSAIVAVIFVIALAGWQAYESVRRNTLGLRPVEQRYVDVGRYIATGMPSDAVLIAALHSGSIRYYSGRMTIYYPKLHFTELDRAVAALTGMGRRPYFVLEQGEEAHFRWQFGANNELGGLDWPPLVQSTRGARVHIYDPADRSRFLAGMPIITYDIDHVEKPMVTRK